MSRPVVGATRHANARSTDRPSREIVLERSLRVPTIVSGRDACACAVQIRHNIPSGGIDLIRRAARVVRCNLRGANGANRFTRSVCAFVDSAFRARNENAVLPAGLLGRAFSRRANRTPDRLRANAQSRRTVCTVRGRIKLNGCTVAARTSVRTCRIRSAATNSRHSVASSYRVFVVSCYSTQTGTNIFCTVFEG